MLLDTSGLLTLLDVRESLHQKARDEYRRASRRITHAFVLAELVALANSRGVPSGAVINSLVRLLGSPKIEVFWPDESLTGQAISLLLARQGRGYSLCDAVSFVLMRGNGVVESLTSDQHFEDEGFQRLLV